MNVLRVRNKMGFEARDFASRLGPARALKTLALAGAYFAAARIGHPQGAADIHTALIWTPSGIGLATLVIADLGLWPGILLGSLLADLATGVTAGISITVGVGNTVEALVGAMLFRKLAVRPQLDRVRDVCVFTFVCAVLSPVISVVFDLSANLGFGGIFADGSWFEGASNLWLAHASGIFLVGSALLVWSAPPEFPGIWSRNYFSDSVFQSALVFSACLIVFHLAPDFIPDPSADALKFLLIPLFMWAAFRIGPRGATFMSLVGTTIAVAGVAADGPFTREYPLQARISLTLIFFCSTLVSNLILTAVISKQRKVETKLMLANREAESANRAKTAFLSNISHEILTPLGAIMGCSELLSEDPRIGEDPIARRFASTIQRNGRALSRLFHDVLDLTQIETDGLTIAPERISLQELVRDIEGRFASYGSEKEIGFKTTIGEGFPSEIIADPRRLKQVLKNLIENAFKFSERGDVSLRLARAGHRIEFEVADTGQGLTSEQAGNLFEAFYQADSSMTRKHGGTGMGLVMARRLATLMGGDVSLRSSIPGVGSVFVFSLETALGGEPVTRSVHGSN